MCNNSYPFQCNRTLHLPGASDRSICANVHVGHVHQHHVPGAALRRPRAEALPRHLPRAGDQRVQAGGGAICQAHIPLQVARDAV